MGASRAAPGSLSLVVVPSCSVIVRLVRTASSVGTQRNGTAADCRAVINGSVAGAGSRATACTPANVSARATLTPLPPASVVTEVTRWTAPRVSGVVRVTVRSMLGLGVTVTIMRLTDLNALLGELCAVGVGDLGVGDQGVDAGRAERS